MNRIPSLMSRSLVVALLGAATALANPPAKEGAAPAKPPAGPPALPKPSEETRKLEKIFALNGTWAGSLKSGAMGPGSPEMPTKGKYLCHPATDGFWYLCDMEVTATAGKMAITWKGFLTVGWDQSSKGYKGLLVDNIGMMVPMDGTLNEKAFVLTSAQALPLMGQMTKARFTWDLTDSKSIKFNNEHQIGDGPWQLYEQETITPVGKHK